MKENSKTTCITAWEHTPSRMALCTQATFIRTSKKKSIFCTIHSFPQELQHLFMIILKRCGFIGAQQFKLAFFYSQNTAARLQLNISKAIRGFFHLNMTNPYIYCGRPGLNCLKAPVIFLLLLPVVTVFYILNPNIHNIYFNLPLSAFKVFFSGT